MARCWGPDDADHSPAVRGPRPDAPGLAATGVAATTRSAARRGPHRLRFRHGSVPCPHPAGPGTNHWGRLLKHAMC